MKLNHTIVAGFLIESIKNFRFQAVLTFVLTGFFRFLDFNMFTFVVAVGVARFSRFGSVRFIFMQTKFPVRFDSVLCFNNLKRFGSVRFVEYCNIQRFGSVRFLFYKITPRFGSVRFLYLIGSVRFGS